MKPIKPIYSASSSGATLAELVITVGMLVSMLLPLVGMLSMAVKNSGEAINTSVGSRISSQLIGEVQQANWSTLTQWNGKDIQFNSQGVQLGTSSSHSDASYMARVRINDIPITNATTGLAKTNSYQMRVFVIVTPFGGAVGKRNLDDADLALKKNSALPRNVQVSRTMLVNMQKDI